MISLQRRQTLSSLEYLRTTRSCSSLPKAEGTHIKDMQNNEFEAQVKLLKSIFTRGGRALLILTFGLGALFYANRRRQQAVAPSCESTMSPSERYIQEMVDGGWPVDEEDVKKFSRKEKI